MRLNIPATAVNKDKGEHQMKFNCPGCKNNDFWLLCQSRKRFSGELDSSTLRDTKYGMATWELCCDRCGRTWVFSSIEEVEKAVVTEKGFTSQNNVGW